MRGLTVTVEIGWADLRSMLGTSLAGADHWVTAYRSADMPAWGGQGAADVAHPAYAKPDDLTMTESLAGTDFVAVLCMDPLERFAIEGTSLVLTDVGGDEGDGSVAEYTLSPADFSRGVSRWLQEQATCTLGDLDGEAGDIILQLAVFGEVRYS